jgi:hypothetical protein
MTDYLNGIIYMIKKFDDYDNENVYIGSTNDIERRKNQHKKRCNNPNDKKYNLKVYQYIRDNGRWDEFVINVIEAYPCSCKRELEKREDEIMCQMDSKLNTNRANRGQKQYRIDNREKILEYNKEQLLEQNKEYYELNKEKILEYNKEWYENNKDKVLEYHKEYYENNKDKKLEYQKEYYENYKDKIKERQKEKIKCDICGFEINRNNLPRHKRSLRCKDFVH